MVYVHFTCWELFFIYLKHLPAKLYFPTNTHLGRKYPFSLCWGKRTFYCEKHISDKTSITKDIRHSCICLLHMLSLTRLFFTIHFYFTMQCLWAWISRTETVGVTFSQYSPACKKEPADSHPNLFLSIWHFFLPACAGSVRHSEANAFCSASTKHGVRKK